MSNLANRVEALLGHGFNVTTHIVHHKKGYEYSISYDGVVIGHINEFIKDKDIGDLSDDELKSYVRESLFNFWS